MSNVAAYPAVVVESPALPGPASDMAYSVAVNTDTGVRTVDGIVPVIERWPDTIDVNPIKVGTFVMVGNVNGRWQLGARELPAFRECGTGSGAAAPDADNRIARLELRLAELERRIAQ